MGWKALWAITAVMSWSLFGCNVLSGADAIGIEGDQNEASTEGTTTTAADGGSSAGGYGGGGSSAQGQGGQGGEPPPECEWPEGPYGVTKGYTLPEDLTWQGFREHTSSETTIAVTEYYDCDGSLGINAVMLLCVKWDCPPCQRESSELEAKMAAWAPLGIKVVVALLEGPSDQEPTVDDAWGWKQNWNLQSVDVVADPDLTLIPEAAFGAPLVSLVDPRTMSVVYWQQGYEGDFSELESLAAQNASP